MRAYGRRALVKVVQLYTPPIQYARTYRAIILAIATITELVHVFPCNTAGALGHALRVGVEATFAASTVCFVGVLGRVQPGVAEELANRAILTRPSRATRS